MPALRQDDTLLPNSVIQAAADLVLTVSHLPADGIHVHNQEGEHLCRPGRARRQGGGGGVWEANDAGAHPASA